MNKVYSQRENGRSNLPRPKRTFPALIALAMVVSLAGTAIAQTEEPRGSDTFSDVPVGHWADEEIGWAVANGITVGVGEGRFDLNGIVTRAQIFTLLYRTINLLQDAPVTVLGSDMFDDVPVGHWADEEIGWAVANGIVSGVSGRTFDLEGTVSRAEMVTFLHRTVNVIQGNPVMPPTGVYDTIVFHRWDGDFEVFVVDADGTNLRQLTNDTHLAINPSWSPDSTQIAFESDRDGDLEIYAMNVDGTNLRQLTNNAFHDWAPSWSPDGSQIAFTSDRGRGWQVIVMDADGTNLRQLTNDYVNNGFPSWSPDGTQIAFDSDRDGDREIYAANVDGTDQRQLTTNDRKDERPTWSPDGTRIAFNSDINSHLETLVMEADGSNQRQLTQSNQNTGGVSWSPDSTKIVYGGVIASGPTLFVINADGTNQRQLNNTFNGSVSGQAWSSHAPVGGSDFFDDVPEGHEAHRAIGWAFTNGITSGVGGGLFGPTGTVNRAQIVTFLYRAVNLLGDGSGT